jgi:hypothetical protein
MPRRPWRGGGKFVTSKVYYPECSKRFGCDKQSCLRTQARGWRVADFRPLESPNAQRNTWPHSPSRQTAKHNVWVQQFVFFDPMKGKPAAITRFGAPHRGPPSNSACLPLPGEGLGPPVIRKGSWIRAILPAMKTDIVLDPPGGGRRVVVGTKFTSILQAGRFGDLRLKCGYLYRMYAYLRSQEGRPAGIKQEDSFSILRSMARCGRSR